MRRGVAEALVAFGTQGSRRALELAKDTLGVARAEVARLVAASQSGEARTVFAILRDLDMSLLESAVFTNLLALDLRKNLVISSAAPSCTLTVEAQAKRNARGTGMATMS